MRERERERDYRRIGFNMGLNEVAKMGVVFEPLVMFLIWETLVLETTTAPHQHQQDEEINEKPGVIKEKKKIPVLRIKVSQGSGGSNGIFQDFLGVLIGTHFLIFPV